MNIGIGIKNVRLRMALTQKHVYTRVGITQGFYSAIENGINNPSLDTLQKIADVLNVPLVVLAWFSLEAKDKRKLKSYYPAIHTHIEEFFAKNIQTKR